MAFSFKLPSLKKIPAGAASSTPVAVTPSPARKPGRNRSLSLELQILVVADQTVVDQLADFGGGTVGGEDRQQIAGVADRPGDERIAVDRHRSRRLDRRPAAVIPPAATGDDSQPQTANQEEQTHVKTPYRVDDH